MSLVVDLSTTPEQLRAWYSRGDARPPQIAATLGAPELIALCRAHARTPYAGALYGTVALHPSADDAVWREMLTLAPGDESVENAVATCGRASPALLHELLASPSDSVREHAELALVEVEVLPSADARRFEELLHQYAGDEGIALGVRSLMARHERTPDAVLEMLAGDEADFIATIARERLARRRGDVAGE